MGSVLSPVTQSASRPLLSRVKDTLNYQYGRNQEENAVNEGGDRRTLRQD